MFDFLIVGAGLFGATCARELADAGKRVLVIEKRDHVAGNCHTTVERGQIRNVYGGHIFHTNDQRLWLYVHRFCDWRQYEHRVKASYQGTVYSFPPNRMTCQQLHVDPCTAEAERRIRQVFFEGYSAKQWGRPLSEVPGSVVKRIPIRDSWDDRYFADEYQGLPAHGYTPLVEEMLRCVRVELGQDYLDRVTYWNEKASRVIFTGPIDALCGYVLGQLEYRSLRFEDEWLDVTDFQGCATMNYTDAAVPYTRILEWRHFWPAQTDATLITREYPEDIGEPYYPVADDHNLDLYAHYRSYAAVHMPNVIVGGRLGSFRYYDMHQVIAAALKLCGELTCPI